MNCVSRPRARVKGPAVTNRNDYPNLVIGGPGFRKPLLGPRVLLVTHDFWRALGGWQPRPFVTDKTLLPTYLSFDIIHEARWLEILHLL